MNKCLVKTIEFKGDALDLFDLFQDEPNVFFLDSRLIDPVTARYSFIGFNAFDVFQGNGRHSFDKLKAKFKKYHMAYDHIAPLSSGIVGYFSYDLGECFENIESNKQKELPLPDCYFGFYDCVLAIDHFSQKIFISSTGLPEKDERLRELKAQDRINYVVKKLSSGKKNAPFSCHSDFFKSAESFMEKLKGNFSKAEYLQTVEKALKYIKEGDIYQVNLSQRFLFEALGTLRKKDAQALYCLLRDLSPSNFCSYFDGGDFQIISSSPERFLNLSKGVAQIRPMKGTRPRGVDETQDKIMKEDLLLSDKDKAELLMVTDLERNDLGRVCDYGSVVVKDMRTLEQYKTVFQTTSTVEGRLRKDKDCFDLIESCFPCGSITGCPKIRSMQIIEQLEPTPRGVYTGALGYVDFSGNMDFNILIRTLVKYKNRISFHVGGGIVSDSDPENEYNETLVKAKAMVESLSLFQEKKSCPKALSS